MKSFVRVSHVDCAQPSSSAGRSGTTRREFLAQFAAATAFAGTAFASEPPVDARIKRIRLATLQGRFQKFIAMNAYDAQPKGDSYEHTLIRIETDSGVEGLAAGSYANLCTAQYAREVQPLIGAKLSELYTISGGRITGRGGRYAALLKANRHLDCAFFDIVGKLTKKPLWSLIGDEGQHEIPVYDTTLYFSDILKPDRGIKSITDDCAESLKSGFRAFKLKLGRGSKWMSRAAGDKRDIDVTLAVREAIGSEARLMADPNYGYRGQYDEALQFMRAVQPARLLWIEEIFPETPEIYSRFRNDLRAKGDNCKIAFGEHMHAPNDVDPYLVSNRLVDYVQYDIRANGYLDNLEVARKCRRAGATIANHNWASQMGYVMALHLARAVSNYGLVECDRSTCEVLRVEVPDPTNGTVPAPSLPGLGISINEDVYRTKQAPKEVVIS